MHKKRKKKRNRHVYQNVLILLEDKTKEHQKNEAKFSGVFRWCKRPLSRNGLKYWKDIFLVLWINSLRFSCSLFLYFLFLTLNMLLSYKSFMLYPVIQYNVFYKNKYDTNKGREKKLSLSPSKWEKKSACFSKFSILTLDIVIA